MLNLLKIKEEKKRHIVLYTGCRNGFIEADFIFIKKKQKFRLSWLDK